MLFIDQRSCACECICFQINHQSYLVEIEEWWVWRPYPVTVVCQSLEPQAQALTLHLGQVHLVSLDLIYVRIGQVSGWPP